MAKHKQGTARLAGFPGLNKELVLGEIIAELLGTMVLTLVALSVSNNPFLIALAVLVIVLVFGKISGAYVNPAFTVAMLVSKKLSAVKATSFVVAQFLGAMLAVVIASRFLKNGDPTAPSTLYTLFDARTGHQVGTWFPLFGELAGAVLFGLGIASAVLEKNEGFEKAFTIAGALLIGIVIALSGSYGVLNPAVALGIGGYSQGGLWSFAAYGLMPIVGCTAGALLYQFMKKDAKGSSQG
ncbi:MAG TPA: aquaporin [Patescibacteria group bacterium]|jgi:glycerol uptake facilitator-like aquaporin|nr:aquaporin [Patescibacteria group bacterium]